MHMTTESDLGLAVIEHTAALRRYARMFARTADQADDLVQDCLARALSRPHLYRPDTNLRAWLFTMLRNIAITHGRREQRRRDHAVDLLATGSGASAPGQLHHVALKQSLRLLKTISAGQRQAIALLGLHDMSYEEAARRTGLDVGTLKSRLSRGRARLRSLTEPALAAAA